MEADPATEWYSKSLNLRQFESKVFMFANAGLLIVYLPLMVYLWRQKCKGSQLGSTLAAVGMLISFFIWNFFHGFLEMYVESPYASLDSYNVFGDESGTNVLYTGWLASGALFMISTLFVLAAAQIPMLIDLKLASDIEQATRINNSDEEEGDEVEFYTPMYLNVLYERKSRD